MQERKKICQRFMPMPDTYHQSLYFGLIMPGNLPISDSLKRANMTRLLPPEKQFDSRFGIPRMRFAIWDMAGQKIFRKNWALSSQMTNIAIFS